MNTRETYAVWAMILCGSAFALFQLILFPVLDENETLDRAIRARTAEWSDMLALKSEHDGIVEQIRQARNRFAERESGFTLFSFLDDLAGRAGTKDQIAYMKPSTVSSKNSPYRISRIEMKIEGTTLDRLVPYLSMIESSKNLVSIQRVSISRTEKPAGFLNAVLLVEASGPETHD